MSGPCGKIMQLAVVMIAVFTLCVNQTDAKRGCSAFGHSCFGGHGKRSETDAGVGMAEGARFAFDVGAPEVAMFVPEDKPSYGNLVHSSERADGEIRYPVSPLLRQWLENYRRLRELGNALPNQNAINY